MNDAVTAMGNASPVMIVERQLCRGSQTIATVGSAPLDQRVAQPGEGGLHDVAQRIAQPQLDVGRQLLAHLLHRRVHRVAGGRDGGILLLEDAECHGVLAIDACQRLGLLLALGQGAQVRNAQRQPRAPPDHQVGEVLRIAHAALERRARRFERDRRDELLVGKPLVRSVRALGLGELRAFRFERRAATRLASSAGSILPTLCPARTRLPSAALGNVEREQGSRRLGAQHCRRRRDQRARKPERERQAHERRMDQLARAEFESDFGLGIGLAVALRALTHAQRDDHPRDDHHPPCRPATPCA
jgi:hypothetical protein